MGVLLVEHYDSLACTTVEPPNKGHFGASSFVPCKEDAPCREVVPISESPLSEVPLYIHTWDAYSD